MSFIRLGLHFMRLIVDPFYVSMILNEGLGLISLSVHQRCVTEGRCMEHIEISPSSPTGEFCIKRGYGRGSERGGSTPPPSHWAPEWPFCCARSCPFRSVPGGDLFSFFSCQYPQKVFFFPTGLPFFERALPPPPPF